MQGFYRKVGKELFTRARSGRAQRVNGFKWKENKFTLANRMKLFTLRVVRCRNKLSREAVDASFLAGSFQGQVGRGFEEPNLVKHVHSHGRGVITR